MKSILTQWIQNGVNLQIDEELYIPTAHKQEQKDFFRELREELKLYKKIDPVGGSQLRIFMKYKEAIYWVVLKKVKVTPLVGFKKSVDGRVSKVQIENADLERIEKLKQLDSKGE